MSKRPLTPPNISYRKKIRRIQTLLNSLRDQIPNMNATLKRKLGIQDRAKVTQLIDALNKLDLDFTFENSKKLYFVIKDLQLSQLQHEYVNTLDKTIDGEIKIKQDTDIARATSKVLLDCEYLGDACVVKVMNKRVAKMDLIIETIINIFMSFVTKNDVNEYISCPDVITMGYLKNFNLPRRYRENAKPSSFSKKKDPETQMTSILVQEKISGEVFDNIGDELVLVQALQQLCRGLDILQDRYNFAHKDFHCNNVMYNTNDGRVYIIDFGYSCFSIPDTNGSIQSLMGGYGINQLDDDYKSHIPCINKSSDLCTLLLSLCYEREYHWLDRVAKSICRKYKRHVRKNNKYSKGFLKLDRNIPEGWKWGQDIFHHWYIYELFHIDIGFTPKVLLRYLLKVEDHIMMVRLQAARRKRLDVKPYEKLKF